MSKVFDDIAARVAGRTTYEHSGHGGGDGPRPTARLCLRYEVAR